MNELKSDSERIRSFQILKSTQNFKASFQHVRYPSRCFIKIIQQACTFEDFKKSVPDKRGQMLLLESLQRREKMLQKRTAHIHITNK